MRLIDVDALIEAVEDMYEYAELDEVLEVIKNAPTVKPQKIVTIPPELIEKLASCVVNTIAKIDWDKAIEAYKERPQGEWITVHYAREELNCPEKSMLDFVKCPFCETIHQGRHNFCSRCGADMRGEEK